MYRRRGIAIAAAVGLSAGWPAQSQAQRPDATCPAAERIGWIGIEEFHCNCTLVTGRDAADREAEWTFRSEPVVDDVADDSPAARVLRRGDVIIAVDGHPITTAEGGRLLGAPEPGQPMRLTIRRDGRRTNVLLTPVALCPNDRRLARFATPRPPTPERPLATPPPDPPPPSGSRADVAPPALPGQMLPTGHLGFALACSDCGWEREGRGEPRWYFNAPPQVYSVEAGSPAERAGLRRGDVILEVDGAAITAETGARRFASVQPRESVRYTIRRNGSTSHLTLRAGDRAAASGQTPPERDRETEEQMILVLRSLERIASMRDLGDMRRELTELSRRLEEPAPPPGPRAQPRLADAASDQLRYTGAVGNADVEVRGAGSVITTIIDPGKDLLIITDGARIRIRVSEQERRSGREGGR